MFLLVLLLYRWAIVIPHFTNEEVKKQTQLESAYTSGGLKRILFWTPFFSGTSLKDVGLTEEGDGYQTFCPYRCKFTTNKNLLHLSDAVLFHSRDLQTNGVNGLWESRNIPETRNWTQHWVFYYFESAEYTVVPLNAFNNVFNQTISYRLDSDIYAPYSRLLPRSLEEINNYARVSETIKKKTKMAAWIVSHCVTKSKREDLVAQLKKYFPIDVYGYCGDLECPGNRQISCYKEIGHTYKFYLSFENSLCEDYVTEKFFNALNAGMVPVVYGGANYLHHAPEGSYISVNSFNSTQDLATYLLMLDKNQTEYLKYFEWKKWLKVDEISMLPRAWCTLCERLTVGSFPKGRVVQDLNDWWFHKQGTNSPACSPPNHQLLDY
ncbi:unnamed protein product [Allacma fusca]|uniref:Fucosyltransferase n=1 Tax=Allacma fusca TaxID=39272 RepID=A0A8J2JKH8_9HEXA|nr:unnamed protein product [Allacma fusca]